MKNGKNKYKIITLCGSTKFKKEFEQVQKELTLKGNIVFSLGIFSKTDTETFNNMNNEELTKMLKMLDDMCKYKIDMSDEIFVINKNKYIGSSTAKEIEYAKSKNKKINYLENID